MTTNEEDATLGEREQEIIAVGASVASGCLPCTKFHIRAARAAGASEREIHDAVRDAAQVRRAATRIMQRAAGWPAEEDDLQPADTPEEHSRIGELVSTSAAYAISCGTTLKEHMNRARAIGVPDRELYEAIRIACAIRDVAGQKARAVAADMLTKLEVGEVRSGCDCAGEGEATHTSPGCTGEGPSKAECRGC
jgi:AhpD family alkylhydroperoxidase